MNNVIASFKMKLSTFRLDSVSALQIITSMDFHVRLVSVLLIQKILISITEVVYAMISHFGMKTDVLIVQ